MCRNNNMSHYLKSTEKEVLVFGYVQTMYESYIPSHIVHLLLQFYDNTVHWMLEGDELDTFYECKNRDYLAGPQFTIYDILFENTLCPNGWFAEDEGFVTYFIELKTLPKHIKRATIQYILYCEEIDYSYKRSIEYHKKHRNAHGWGAFAVALSKFNDANGSKYKKLHFGCCIDVIHIEFNDCNNGCGLTDIITPIRITDASFTWNIECSLLEAFKNAQTDELFYSESFGNECWFLMCKPFGSRTNESEQQFSMALRLLRLPFDTESVQIRYTLVPNSNGHDLIDFRDVHAYISITETFTMNSNWKDLPMKIYSLSTLDTLSSLSFTIVIQVINIK
eukprot:922518_1